MTLLGYATGFFFALAFILRELQLARERALHLALQEQLRLSIESTQTQLCRVMEDFFVLQTVLIERHILDDTEIARNRSRLVDEPRRMAEEKDAIARHLGVSTSHLLVDESSDKVH